MALKKNRHSHKRQCVQDNSPRILIPLVLFINKIKFIKFIHSNSDFWKF